MKKLILVLAAIAITAGVYAQADSANRKMSPQDVNKTQNQNLQNNPQDLNTPNQNNPQDMNKTQNPNLQSNPVGKTHPDGIMMQNGKMMVVKNGQITSLDQDMTLSNGTKVMSDGSCIKKDGTKMTMKEGQHMDMSGNMIPIKTDKDKNMNPVPDNNKKK